MLLFRESQASPGEFDFSNEIQTGLRMLKEIRSRNATAEQAASVLERHIAGAG